MTNDPIAFSLLKAVTVMSQERYGEPDTDVIAVLVDLYYFDQSNTNQKTMNRGGGVSVQSDGTVRLYGNLSKLYQLSTNLAVNKYKRMSFQFNLLEGSKGSQETEICMYEKFSPTSETGSCPPICFTPEEGSNYMNIGAMFNDRMTSITVIEVIQKRGLSELKHLRMYSDLEEEVVGNDDECTDRNARRVRRMGPTGCYCLDGYVSSNGGKLRGLYDTCLSCLGTIPTTSVCLDENSESHQGEKCAEVSTFVS